MTIPGCQRGTHSTEAPNKKFMGGTDVREACAPNGGKACDAMPDYSQTQDCTGGACPKPVPAPVKLCTDVKKKDKAGCDAIPGCVYHKKYCTGTPDALSGGGGGGTEVPEITYGPAQPGFYCHGNWQSDWNNKID